MSSDDALNLGPPTGDDLLDLQRYFLAQAEASSGTIAALGAITGPGEDLRALSIRYAEGARDAYRDAAAMLDQAREQLGEG